MAAENSSVTLETLQAPVEPEHLPLLCELLYEESPGWEQFGNALYVDYDTIQGIRLQPLRKEPRQQMISLLNKIKKEKSNMYTWEEIKRVLTALRNNRLASKVTKTGPVTCSTEELVNFLEDEVPNWKRFGSYMKVSQATLKAMDSDKLTPTDCLEELLTKWIEEKGEKATLAEIFRACHSVKNHALVKKLEENDELRKEFCSGLELTDSTQTMSNGICRVYRKNACYFTIVIARKDKAESIRRGYPEGTYKQLFDKEVTVEDDIKLEGQAPGPCVWECTSNEIKKTYFENGHLCAIDIEIVGNTTEPLKLIIAGVSPPENEITIPLKFLPKFVYAGSSGHSTQKCK